MVIRMGKVREDAIKKQICRFQDPIIEFDEQARASEVNEYRCVLTIDSVKSYAIYCNPDMCPIYQTWQILKKSYR